MSKVVMFSHRPIFDKDITSGPGIRVYEIAKALQKKGHKVSIAEIGRKKTEKKFSLNFIVWNDKLLENIENKFDVAILQAWNDEIDFLEKLEKIPKAVDLYSPTLIEHANFCSEKTKLESYYLNGKIDYFFDDVIMNLSRIIMSGDFFFCANENQKVYYTGVLNILGVLNPRTYKEKLIEIIPFGISSEKPNKEISGLQIKNKKSDKIIVWVGGINPWFDAITALKAMKLLQKEKSQIKLVFVGANNPVDSQFTDEGFKEAYHFAKKENLLNNNVFFHNWLPFNKREIMYNEAEAAIVISKAEYENQISHRTRIIDCLWGEIPVITTKGSEVSRIIEEERLGITIEENDYKKLAETIKGLIKNSKLRKQLKKNISEYNKSITWDKLVEPINQFCLKPRILSKEKFNPYNLLSAKQKSVEICEKQITRKDETIKKSEKEIMEKNEQIKSLFDILNNQKINLEKQTILIGRFRNSVVYPFFILTSRIGKTKFGRIVSRILK